MEAKEHLLYRHRLFVAVEEPPFDHFAHRAHEPFVIFNAEPVLKLSDTVCLVALNS